MQVKLSFLYSCVTDQNPDGISCFKAKRKSYYFDQATFDILELKIRETLSLCKNLSWYLKFQSLNIETLGWDARISTHFRFHLLQNVRLLMSHFAVSLKHLDWFVQVI